MQGAGTCRLRGVRDWHWPWEEWRSRKQQQEGGEAGALERAAREPRPGPGRREARASGPIQWLPWL